MRQEHAVLKHELNSAKDNVDTLMVDNNKVQAMIEALAMTIQAKQNSYNDLAMAHTDLQIRFDALKNSMDTLDKQHLIKAATNAKGEAEQCKTDMMKSNDILREMVGTQYQFQCELEACDLVMKVLLLHAHNLISGNNPHQGMELEAAQALLELLGYKKVTDGEPLKVRAMLGDQEGRDWLLQLGLQP